MLSNYTANFLEIAVNNIYNYNCGITYFFSFIDVFTYFEVVLLAKYIANTNCY
jgi:hypothetical protein